MRIIAKCAAAALAAAMVWAGTAAVGRAWGPGFDDFGRPFIYTSAHGYEWLLPASGVGGYAAAVNDREQVVGNTIYYCGRSGIVFRHSAAVSILRNVVHDCGLQLTDVGGIYTFGTDGQGTQVAGNAVSIDHTNLASAEVRDGTLAVIRFVPRAEAADIATFLVANNASVIDGPMSGGMYTIRLPETGKAKEDHIKQMQAQSSIVDIVAPKQ